MRESSGYIDAIVAVMCFDSLLLLQTEGRYLLVCCERREQLGHKAFELGAIDFSAIVF